LRCRAAPVDVLLVRAVDIPEYVQDHNGVDCGITGLDLVAESGANVDVLERLGFGSCQLEAAVPEESHFESLTDLNGACIATAHPNITKRELAQRGIAFQLCSVSGSVEIAPRMGLADAIVDLVSSGVTLRTNGLRSLGVLFESQAVLIGSATANGQVGEISAALASVAQARDTRYLMFNAPRNAVDSVCAALPTTGSPTIVPLLSPDSVAIHVLIPSTSVWTLLPQLRSLGASSILVTSVERKLG
jgi:ATP phosphoribosyltransferase